MHSFKSVLGLSIGMLRRPFGIIPTARSVGSGVPSSVSVTVAVRVLRTRQSKSLNKRLRSYIRWTLICIMRSISDLAILSPDHTTDYATENNSQDKYDDDGKEKAQW
jgi:hypothetical protein